MSNQNEIYRGYELGQPFCLDYIRRDLVEEGELANLILADETGGVSSRPSIQDHGISRLDMTYGALQQAAMLADYGKLKKSGAQVSAIQRESPITLSQWLRESRLASERSAYRIRNGSKASPELQGS
ncbi:MAG: hypothetical protein ACC700_16240 [Anaerolineales bacterium]